MNPFLLLFYFKLHQLPADSSSFVSSMFSDVVGIEGKQNCGFNQMNQWKIFRTQWKKLFGLQAK